MLIKKYFIEQLISELQLWFKTKTLTMLDIQEFAKILQSSNRISDLLPKIFPIRIIDRNTLWEDYRDMFENEFWKIEQWYYYVVNNNKKREKYFYRMLMVYLIWLLIFWWWPKQGKTIHIKEDIFENMRYRFHSLYQTKTLKYTIEDVAFQFMLDYLIYDHDFRMSYVRYWWNIVSISEEYWVPQEFVLHKSYELWLLWEWD